MVHSPAVQPPLSSVLELVGQTPLVRVDRIAKEEGLKCNLYVKIESTNPGGSTKDRIALRMVEAAEADGRLIPGKSVIVEASSGNTGIALAMIAAVKGYRCIITMPEKMSAEKENIMKGLGAELIRTPTEAPHDSPESNMGRAAALVKEIPHAVMLNQYDSPDNPDAHYHGTGVEIAASLALTVQSGDANARPSSGLCDVLVAGAGTGGTISGIGRRLIETNPDVLVIGADPRGSILARPESLNVLEEGESDIYQQEGVGYDFIPGALKHEFVHKWIKTNDKDTFATARRLIRTEGILCGGSSGGTLAAALEYLKSEEGAKKHGQVEGQNVVVLLADGIRNYTTSQWFTAAP